MKVHLKSLRDQVIVLTGATSGIGLVTARQAAQTGARLVLAARNEDALRELTEELGAGGAEVAYVVADVGQESDVQRIADTAIERFGGFDTWINNAAVSIYGKVEDIPIDDQRRLFDTNYWGVVFGSRIACRHLRERGGKLINVGSALSERAIPIQGVYSASKAAVMGFTDALRMELEQDAAPVSVTLIKPGAIDTPYKDHAGNYMGVKGQNPPPVYAPDTVARAILYAAEHHTRDVVVGAGGKLITTIGNVAPRITDKVMGTVMPYLQRTREPSPSHSGALYEPQDDLQERGGYAVTFERSLYSAAVRHKFLTMATVLGTATAVYLLTSERGQQAALEALERAREAADEALHRTRVAAGETFEHAQQAAGQRYERAAHTADDAWQQARTLAGERLEHARDTLRSSTSGHWWRPNGRSSAADGWVRGLFR